MTEQGTVRFIVAGRVQGVGYRWFARGRAQQLDLAGWAKNLPDGRVEVVARGPADALAALGTSLAEGPRFAVVENVERSDIEGEDMNLNQFSII